MLIGRLSPDQGAPILREPTRPHPALARVVSVARLLPWRRWNYRVPAGAGADVGPPNVGRTLPARQLPQSQTAIQGEVRCSRGVYTAFQGNGRLDASSEYE
eukprot:m.43363 g.43363  ORF g.43363 m.43363 type:complete len:101 (+) comp8424_c0_seq1:920-1222(+)